jgi:hypothetical protein
MPTVGVLARGIDNLYILGNPAHNVKISLAFPLNLPRSQPGSGGAR